VQNEKAMRFVEVNIESIRKYLSTEFWLGKRWLSFDIQKQLGSAEDLHCFFNYQTATSFCYDKHTEGAEFRIRAIGPILKVLNKGQVRPTILERRHLQVALATYPIKYCLPESCTEKILLSGDFCPVLWNKAINLLSNILQYHIIERRLDGERTRKGLHHSSFQDFPNGIMEFNKLVKTAQTNGSNSEFLFVGQFNEYPFQPGDIDISNNSNVLFYRAFSDYANDLEHVIEQVNDPTASYLIEYGIFLHFDVRNGRLLFFDGSLKKVLPGATF
jgi:hypothetical protein